MPGDPLRENLQPLREEAPVLISVGEHNKAPLGWGQDVQDKGFTGWFLPVSSHGWFLCVSVLISILIRTTVLLDEGLS